MKGGEGNGTAGMRDGVKTTVVIPNYNGRKYLEGCLASLESCGDRCDVVVVDNGSTDGSAELVRKRFPGVKLIELTENTGFCHAVNEGIRVSSTPYVFLLNNDTTVAPGAVRALEEALERDSGAFSAAAKMLSMREPDLIDGAGDLYCALGWAFALGKGRRKECYVRRSRIFSACGGAALYRRSMLAETGLFDEAHFAYLEDLDLGWRAQLMGYHHLYEPSAVVYHAGSAASGSRYNAFKVRLSVRNNVYVIYKNMPFLQIVLNLPFLTIGFLVKLLFFIKKGYGMIYSKGFWQGVRLCRKPESKEKKMRFRISRLGTYVRVQLELWGNMFRRLTG